MRSLLYVGLCSVLAITLTGCGGSKGGDQSPRVSYTRLVTFGDSLSDAGTYKVSTIAAIGGGEFTVNSGGGENWTELLAAQLGLDAPCPAVTGLDSVIPQIPAAPVNADNTCYNYAMGGARVTNPVGPGNLALYTNFGDTSGELGQLTYPITQQIDNFLADHGGYFTAGDLVTVMAGGNDLFMEAAAVQNSNETASTAVTNMATAATELVGYIQNKILANGATHVVVVNLPDVSLTPYALSQAANAQALVSLLVTTFNNTLAAGLAGLDNRVMLVDAYTQSRDQYAHPAQYGLTNVTTPACDLTNSRGQTTTAAQLLAAVPTSLLCTTDTTLATDVSRYEYADTVHPTPYGYKLLASLVTTRMALNGWL